jgi:hypothetical protein
MVSQGQTPVYTDVFQQGTIFRVEAEDYFAALSNSLKRNESYGLWFGIRPAIYLVAVGSAAGTVELVRT